MLGAVLHAAIFSTAPALSAAIASFSFRLWNGRSVAVTQQNKCWLVDVLGKARLGSRKRKYTYNTQMHSGTCARMLARQGNKLSAAAARNGGERAKEQWKKCEDGAMQVVKAGRP